MANCIIKAVLKHSMCFCFEVKTQALKTYYFTPEYCLYLYFEPLF